MSDKFLFVKVCSFNSDKFIPYHFCGVWICSSVTGIEQVFYNRINISELS